MFASGPGTTETVLSEVTQELPCALKVYKVKAVEQELLELFTDKTVKHASLADLSLIQAARKHPEVQGIVTYDVDFKNLATAGLVRTKERWFFVGTADEVLRKYGSSWLQEKKNNKRKETRWDHVRNGWCWWGRPVWVERSIKKGRYFL